MVVNLTDSPTFDDASPAFFRQTMGNLLTAAAAAGDALIAKDDAVIAATAYRDWLAR